MIRIVKPTLGSTSFLINIPKAIVKRRKWEIAQYLVIEDRIGEDLKIRRLEDEELRETGNEGSRNEPDRPSRGDGAGTDRPGIYQGTLGINKGDRSFRANPYKTKRKKV
jgi:bifunctional DNA-binding transcriptional regulator/antitoxin component of YhaV-PrlF toxin-antitoxin module